MLLERILSLFDHEGVEEFKPPKTQKSIFNICSTVSQALTGFEVQSSFHVEWLSPSVRTRIFDQKLNLWSSVTSSNAHGMSVAMWRTPWMSRGINSCSTHQEFIVAVPNKSAVECLLRRATPDEKSWKGCPLISGTPCCYPLWTNRGRRWISRVFMSANSMGRFLNVGILKTDQICEDGYNSSERSNCRRMVRVRWPCSL